MAGGGLIQLVSYGAQDTYLTGNPQITFFKSYYRRHSAFATEDIEVPYSGTPGFGNRVSFTLSRNGDLVREISLEAKLPNIGQYTGWYYLYDPVTQTWNGPVAPGSFDVNEYPIYSGLDDITSNPAVFYYPPSPAQQQVVIAATKQARVIVQDKQWCPLVGYRLLKEVSLEIGGQMINKLYSDWLYIWSELTTPPGKLEKLVEMTGPMEPSVDIPESLYITLPFWFNGNPGLALPLIALQYHEVKVIVHLESFANLIIPTTVTTFGTTPVAPTPPAVPPQLTMWCSYVFLDTDERRRYAQLSHEYLIDQVQLVEDRITGQVANTSITFNNPVKELIWTVQKEGTENWLELSTGSRQAVTRYIVDHSKYYATSNLVMYGGSNWTAEGIPEGEDWIPVFSNEDDENSFQVPDIGYDLFLAGSNVRDKIEFWTNGYIKFDGLLDETLGDEDAYFPDGDTPKANSIHFGSDDMMVEVSAYKIVQEAGMNVLVYHSEAIVYNQTDTQTIHVCEVSIFENGDIRFSLPDSATLFLRNTANFGLTNGSVWLYRLPPPLQAGASYVLNFSTNFAIPYPVLARDPSILIIGQESDNNELPKAVRQSRFNNITYSETDFSLSTITTRPDVIYLFDNANIDEDPASARIIDWVKDGSLLVLNGGVANSQLNTTRTFGLYNSDDYSNGYYTDISTEKFAVPINNEFVKSVLPYAQTSFREIIYLAPDVQVLAYPNGLEGSYAALYTRKLGKGAILMDEIVVNGTANVNYRIQFWNEIYEWAAGTPTYASPVSETSLLLNGQKRFASRPGSYFGRVQPYQHHTHIPTRNDIHVYSFALRPEDHQPSGSLNFSRIDTAVLRNIVNYTEPSRLRVFAKSVNVLRIMGGMGGLAYMS